jgi:hypothetical protein
MRIPFLVVALALPLTLASAPRPHRPHQPKPPRVSHLHLPGVPR